MWVKMTKTEKLNEIIKCEIRKLAEDFKKQNGNSSLRIPNKDMNLWIIKEIMELRGDINLVKLKTKLLMWFFGATMALMTIFQVI